MSAFSVDTGRQTTPPLVDGVVHNRLVQFAPHGDKTLAQLVDVLVKNFFRIKWYKNYKYRLRLAKVIVKNKMSRFYGSLCSLL